MNLSLFLRLGRVSNLPTVWSNVLAGAVLSGATLGVNSLALLCLSFSLFYVGGMFLNDAFDAEFDKEQRAERPIPQGLIARSTVFFMGGALLVLATMLVALHGMLFENQVRLEPMMYAGALAICIIWYNADHKENFMGPVLMGFNRVYVYATTAFALSAEPEPLLWYGCGALMSYLVGLTLLAQQENLTSLRSLWPLGFMVVPFGYPLAAVWFAGIEPDWPLTAVLLLALAAWIVRAVFLFRPKTGSPKIQSGIVSLIAGISILDAVAGGLVHDMETSGLCLVAFSICLVAQKRIAGT